MSICSIALFYFAVGQLLDLFREFTGRYAIALNRQAIDLISDSG
jgi:hypothetical protein